MGYIVFILANLLTGDLFDYAEDLAIIYVPDIKPFFDLIGEKIPFISRKHKENKRVESLNRKLLERGTSSDMGYYYY